MSPLCYFLIFRRYISCKRELRWNKPTGGLVMIPDRVVDGHSVADMCLASDVIELRYHCGPHEELIVVEVFSKREKRLAERLHEKWEAEYEEFVELMECSY